MPQHVGFYEVITDGSVTLTQPNGDLDQSFTFTPPANAAIDNPAVLSFMLRVKKAVDLQLQMSLNGVLVVVLNEDGDYRGFVQEVVGKNLIKPGLANTLLCKI